MGFNQIQAMIKGHFHLEKPLRVTLTPRLKMIALLRVEHP